VAEIDICRTDPLFSWFGHWPWLIRYASVVAIVYVPAALITILAGTFRQPCRIPCHISFVQDYTFHIIWALAVPLSLSLIPFFFDETESMFQTLQAAGAGAQVRERAVRTPGEPLLSPEALNRVGQFNHGAAAPVVGLAMGLIVVTAVALRNLLSLSKAEETIWSWWFPSGRFCAATVLFLVLWAIVSWVCFTVLVRYFYTVSMIRAAVSHVPSGGLPAWLAGSNGALWPFFRAFSLALLPLAVIPIFVWMARTFRGGIPLADPVTMLNALALPAAISLLLIVPALATGVPSRLREQRRHLLFLNAVQTTRVLDRLAAAETTADSEPLLGELESLSSAKAEIEDAYSTWPLPGNSFRRFALTLLPLLISVAQSLGAKFLGKTALVIG